MRVQLSDTFCITRPEWVKWVHMSLVLFQFEQVSDSPLVWLKTYKNVSRTAVLENACKPISIKIAICLCIAVISQTACFIENCLLRLHIKQGYLDNSFTLSLFPETIKRYNNIFVKKLSATHIVGQGAVIWILLKGEGNVCILYGQ